MNILWDLVTDKKTVSMLKDVTREVDGEVSRLLFLDLVRRVKTLEEENLTLQVLLEELQIFDEELFKETRQSVRRLLKMKEEQKEAECAFFSGVGVSFPQWVNFRQKGSFEDQTEK